MDHKTILGNNEILFLKKVGKHRDCDYDNVWFNSIPKSMVVLNKSDLAPVDANTKAGIDYQVFDKVYSTNRLLPTFYRSCYATYGDVTIE